MNVVNITYYVVLFIIYFSQLPNMEPDTNNESLIQSEVEALRDKFPNTQDLYTEVCVLLFFRHGITPSANKLYQLVRKGSMSAPAEALGKFWGNLREKSRIRIENPDIPEDLKIVAGEMVGAIWTKAQGVAHESLNSLRADALKSAQQAEARLLDAESEKKIALQSLQEAIITIKNTENRARELEQSLAGEVSTRVAMESQLELAQLSQIEQQKAITDARRDFSSELEKLRQSLKLTEERYMAAESRALLEIDRERTIAVKLQKELEKTRSTASETATRYQAEVHSLQSEIGNQKQRNGNIEGELHSACISNELLVKELSQERGLVRNLMIQVSAATKEVEALNEKIIILQKKSALLISAKQRKPRKVMRKIVVRRVD